jgi:hypothetical protein
MQNSKMFGYIAARIDFFKAKQFPGNPNPFLTTDINHPARGDPAPGADRIPVKIDSIF